MTNLRNYFTQDQIDKLECMNYHVSNNEGHYYIQTGILGLNRFCVQHTIRFLDLFNALLDDGQYSEYGQTITMI